MFGSRKNSKSGCHLLRELRGVCGLFRGKMLEKPHRPHLSSLLKHNDLQVGIILEGIAVRIRFRHECDQVLVPGHLL